MSLTRMQRYGLSLSFSLWILLLPWASSGQTGTPAPVKISGCLMGINGSFKLLANDGTEYLLKNMHSTLFGYNGMFVEITGTVSPLPKKSTQTRMATLHISKIKKLADSCQ